MNARRHGSYLFAGIDLDSKSWIRPSGSALHGGMTREEQAYEDSRQPEVFDIVELSWTAFEPPEGRLENCQTRAGEWRKVGAVEQDERRTFVEELVSQEPAFGTNEPSLSVWSVAKRGNDAALTVLKPTKLTWIKGLRGHHMRLMAAFEHAGARHRLPVVDHRWLNEFIDSDVGQYPQDERGDVFLVVTVEALGDEFWKTVCSVIAVPKLVTPASK